MKSRAVLTCFAFVSLLASCQKEEYPVKSVSPYVTKVLEYMPGPGQYTNTLPLYEVGDTQKDMNDKALESIGGDKGYAITLGAYGGYVVVGFDHTIQNLEGECDFRVLGNAYYSESADKELVGGSCEAGIIMVSYDANGNGEADDKWYEIAGSSHVDVAQESWYDAAFESGNDVAFYRDYQITYSKSDAASGDIVWSDNKGAEGVISVNDYHEQSYFPAWVEQSSISFSGSRLPQNGVQSGSNNFVLCKFAYGYADNDYNKRDGSTIDISWAVDSQGNSVNLDGVDFIKIYTGVNQVNGWLGECSTEVAGVVDLHICVR